jgi:hypothetical protein
VVHTKINPGPRIIKRYKLQANMHDQLLKRKTQYRIFSHRAQNGTPPESDPSWNTLNNRNECLLLSRPRCRCTFTIELGSLSENHQFGPVESACNINLLENDDADSVLELRWYHCEVTSGGDEKWCVDTQRSRNLNCNPFRCCNKW